MISTRCEVCDAPRPGRHRRSHPPTPARLHKCSARAAYPRYLRTAFQAAKISTLTMISRPALQPRARDSGEKLPCKKEPKRSHSRSREPRRSRPSAEVIGRCPPAFGTFSARQNLAALQGLWRRSAERAGASRKSPWADEPAVAADGCPDILAAHQRYHASSTGKIPRFLPVTLICCNSLPMISFRPAMPLSVTGATRR